MVDRTVVNGLADGTAVDGLADGTAVDGLADGTAVNGLADGTAVDGPAVDGFDEGFDDGVKVVEHGGSTRQEKGLILPL